MTSRTKSPAPLHHRIRDYLSQKAGRLHCVRINGYSIRFDLTSDASREWFRTRPRFQAYHEQPVVEALLNGLNDCSCFLDVGAFLGYYATIMGVIHPQASIHAFEINPALVPDIRRNFKINDLGNANVICGSVANQSARVDRLEFHQPGNPTTGQSAVDGTGANHGGLFVPSLSLGDYCAKLNIKPDAIKIDVEGAESEVLEGLGDFLGEVKVLVLELHPKMLIERGHKPESILRDLRSSGFRVTLMHAHRRQAYELVSNSDRIDQSLDENCVLLATRK